MHAAAGGRLPLGRSIFSIVLDNTGAGPRGASAPWENVVFQFVPEIYQSPLHRSPASAS